MCLAIEAKVLEVNGNKAIADFGTHKKEVVVPFENLKVGDKVRCFGGYVIEKA